MTGPRDELDRTRPSVRALGGSARRGPCAFLARMSDNSGEARLDVQLTYRGVPVVEGKASFAPATWDARSIRSTRSLSRRLYSRTELRAVPGPRGPGSPTRVVAVRIHGERRFDAPLVPFTGR